MTAAAKVPVERLELHWAEVLSADHEVIRVLRNGQSSLLRVVPHKSGSWRVEWWDTAWNVKSWRTVMTVPVSKWGARNVRTWRSPAAAMVAAEKMFRDRAGLQPGDPQEKKR